jgi:hypothetical protein
MASRRRSEATRRKNGKKRSGDARKSAASAAGHVIGPYARLLCCALLLLTTLAPYFYCRSRVSGAHFLWILPPYPEDSLAYLAWERQAMSGAWLFALKYTALPHAPFLFQPFFLVVGLLARFTGMAVPATNLLVKAIGTALFVHVWFRFVSAFRLGRADALFATALMAFSSGLGGWIAPFFRDAAKISADLWLVDLNTYWSLQWNSLFPFSMALILETTVQAEEALRDRCQAHALRAGLCLTSLALVHPYQVPMLGVYCLVRWAMGLGRAAWRPAWVFGAVSLVPVAYLIAMELGQPLLARHATHGQMLTPAAPQVLLGLGVPLLFAVAGSLRRATRRDGLVLFIALGVLGAYVPCWFQRKLLFGLHPVICAAAGLAFGMLPVARSAATRRLRWTAASVLVALLSASSLTVVKSQVENVLRPGLANPFAVDDDVWRTLEYLRANTRPSDVVFASPALSALIPAVSGNTVIWGHWAQSVDVDQRVSTLKRAFSPDSGLSDAERSGEFWSMGMKYLLVDPSFRLQLLLGEPRWLTGDLEQIWESGAIAVYKRSGTP